MKQNQETKTVEVILPAGKSNKTLSAPKKEVSNKEISRMIPFHSFSVK